MGHPPPMLRIDDISYAVAGRPLLMGASATIPDGHKVGLVGRNGSGKSSLLKRMATGMIPGFPLHLKVKYVSQELPLVVVGG